jgi:hypothetical protein
VRAGVTQAFHGYPALRCSEVPMMSAIKALLASRGALLHRQHLVAPHRHDPDEGNEHRRVDLYAWIASALQADDPVEGDSPAAGGRRRDPESFTGS